MSNAGSVSNERESMVDSTDVDHPRPSDPPTGPPNNLHPPADTNAELSAAEATSAEAFNVATTCNTSDAVTSTNMDMDASERNQTSPESQAPDDRIELHSRSVAEIATALDFSPTIPPTHSPPPSGSMPESRRDNTDESVTSGFYKQVFGSVHGDAVAQPGTEENAAITPAMQTLDSALAFLDSSNGDESFVNLVDPEKVDADTPISRPESPTATPTGLIVADEAIVEAHNVLVLPADHPVVQLTEQSGHDVEPLSTMTENSRRKQPPFRVLGLVLVIAVVVALAMLGGTCAGSRCFRRDASPTLAPMSSAQSRDIQIVDYINSIALTGQNLTLRDVAIGASVESLALSWLINNDTMKLSPNSPFEQFRLRQRYALRLLCVAQPSSFDNGSLDECGWMGITCNSTDLGTEIGIVHAVTEIKLPESNWSGQIVSDLGLLSNLVRFDMTSNWVSGVLSDTIGRWTGLKHFSVEWNALVGSLPTTIGRWTDLEHFNANRNRFTGTLPESVGNWSKLEHFAAIENRFASPLPDFIGKWSNLKHFSIGRRGGFTGTLPHTVGQWTNLEYFDVFESGLAGSLPPSVAWWTGLTEFRAVSNHQLRGSLSDAVGNWTNLKSFVVDDNGLTGSLPSSIGQWTQLVRFWASTNGLTGPLPTSIGRWSDLETFRVSQNRLTGSLPPDIGQWLNIEDFDVSTNSFTGLLPDSIANWNRLHTASFQSNGFLGSVPIGVCDAANLSKVLVDYTMNCTCGSIVCEFYNV